MEFELSFVLLCESEAACKRWIQSWKVVREEGPPPSLASPVTPVSPLALAVGGMHHTAQRVLEQVLFWFCIRRKTPMTA